MTPADQARDSALHCEAKKHAYRQTQDGVVVSFVLHPDEVPGSLATAPLGARYVLALVQIGDDELPVPAKENGTKPRQVKPRPDGASREKMDWREVQPAAQAGIRCGEAAFVRFLQDNYGEDFQAMERDAAATVRYLCGVNSRAELGTKHAARVIWHQLDNQYQAWMRVS